MIPPQLAILLAQYGTKILAALILAAGIVGGYYYWHHQVYQEGYNEAESLYKARDAKNAIKAKDILAAAKKSVDDKTKENDNILIGVLTHNEQQIKTLISQRDDALTRSLRINTKANANSGNALPGKASIQQGDAGRGESACDQELASDNQRKLVNAEYKIARLADLHLQCIEQIERTHTLK